MTQKETGLEQKLKIFQKNKCLKSFIKVSLNYPEDLAENLIQD